MSNKYEFQYLCSNGLYIYEGIIVQSHKTTTYRQLHMIIVAHFVQYMYYIHTMALTHNNLSRHRGRCECVQYCTQQTAGTDTHNCANVSINLTDIFFNMQW